MIFEISQIKKLCHTIIFIMTVDSLKTIPGIKLMMPNNYMALTSDFNLKVAVFESNFTSHFVSANIKINELNGKSKEMEISKIYQRYHHSYSLIDITLDCKYFVHGGTFQIGVILNKFNSTSSDINERLTQNIDITWPTAKLKIKRTVIATYPDYPVEVVLTFPTLECDFEYLKSDTTVEFWFELMYCNQDTTCGNSNSTNHYILYTDRVKGYPKSHLYTFRCELFGLAGFYAVRLRSLNPASSFTPVMEFMRADWNQKFVFNVHARSIFPCDPHTGLGVLFEYPSCILDQADRIRLFGKLRADVSSLKSPTSLHYVTEKKVKKGQHSLYFDCDFFSEKYVGYCFTYVSQSSSGAVADIRMDCVPTLPVTDSETGGWGPWSEWTPCSKKCLRGTRNRYRFCDSPAPRYGAKFCEGSAVQTEYCGERDLDTWKCLYEIETSFASHNKVQDEVVAEIGPGCRCGCIVHLGSSKPKRVIAATAQSCPGRSFWLITAENDMRIRINIEFIRLPCIKQYIKLRDGDSLASNFISQFGGKFKQSTEEYISSGSNLLLEFASDDVQINADCKGGFLAKVYQIYSEYNKPYAVLSQLIVNKPRIVNTVVHITVVIFSSVIIILSAILGAQYIHKYKKYHLTNNKIGQGSPISTPRTSLESVQNLTSKAISTSTLFSDVFYLVKLRPRNCSKHSVLFGSDISSHVTSKSDNEFKYECIDATRKQKKSCRNIQSLSCENIYDIIKIKKEYLKHEKRPESDIPKRRVFNHVDIISKDCVPLNKIHKPDLTNSNTTILTHGCYSPAANIVCKAAIRTTDQKEKKDERNRAKLLSRPDSEFSIANPEDLELDYYDYNVINAGAAPGSYLGMDPAYLIWIPPFDEDNILTEICCRNELETSNVGNNFDKRNYKILPNYNCITSPADINTEIQPPLDNKQGFDMHSNSELENIQIGIPLKSELIYNIDTIDIIKEKFKKCISKIECSEEEKETAVEKSSCDLQNYCQLADIKFVDEEENSVHDELINKQ